MFYLIFRSGGETWSSSRAIIFNAKTTFTASALRKKQIASRRAKEALLFIL